MPRTLPAGLAAAITGPSASPSISVTSNDLLTRFSLFGTTGPNSPARNAAILSSAGSVIRAAVSQGTDPQSVYVYRVATPSSPSSWQVGGTGLTANAHCEAGVALVQTGSTIRCFWIDNTDQKPRYADSTNDGQSWGAVQAGFPSPPLTNNLTFGLCATDTSHLFVLYADYSYAACGIYETIYSSGSWGAFASVGPSSPTWGAARGIQCEPAMSPTPFAAGVQMRAQQSGYAAAATTLNGSTWSAFQAVLPMDTPNNGLSLMYPTIHYDGSKYAYFTALLTDDGSISGTAQSRLTLFRTTDGTTFSILGVIAGGSGGSPFGYEVHAIQVAGVLYVFDQVNIYTGSSPAGPVDLSADVLQILVGEASLEHRTIAIKVANQNGQYLGNAQLRDNATVDIQLGYNGLLVDCFHCYVDAIRFEVGGDTNEMVIEGRGVAKFLDQVAPVPFSYIGYTLGAMVTALCNAMAVPLAALPATTQFSQTVPCFIVSAGETYFNALKRCSQIFGFDLLESPPGTVKIVERSASDPSSWSYGSDLLAASYQTNADQPNIIRVVGQNTSTQNIFAEVTDAANSIASGVHRFELVVDRMLDTSAKCLIRATLELHDDQSKSSTGGLAVTLNPQLELMDVIAITEPRLGLANTPMRIHDIQTHIDFQSGDFIQHLLLQAP